MEWMLGIVSVVALGLAIAMGMLAWRILRGDRQRTDARVALLRHMAFEPEGPSDTEPEELRWQDAALPPPSVFASVGEPAPPRSRRWMVAAVVVVFMAVGAGSVYGLYSPGAFGERVSAALAGAPSRAGDTMPLDLLSLRHQVEDGDFVVTGLVQNPRDGRRSPPVVAVVYAFNAKGEYFASAKAELEFPTLAPGAESPFVVRLPKTSGVSRFRIGFRTMDGSVVAHADRRGQPLEDTTAGASSVAEGM
jgi:hypothetical protein